MNATNRKRRCWQSLVAAMFAFLAGVTASQMWAVRLVGVHPPIYSPGDRHRIARNLKVAMLSDARILIYHSQEHVGDLDLWNAKTGSKLRISDRCPLAISRDEVWLLIYPGRVVNLATKEMDRALPGCHEFCVFDQAGRVWHLKDEQWRCLDDSLLAPRAFGTSLFLDALPDERLFPSSGLIEPRVAEKMEFLNREYDGCLAKDWGVVHGTTQDARIFWFSSSRHKKSEVSVLAFADEESTMLWDQGAIRDISADGSFIAAARTPQAASWSDWRPWKLNPAPLEISLFHRTSGHRFATFPHATYAQFSPNNHFVAVCVCIEHDHYVHEIHVYDLRTPWLHVLVASFVMGALAWLVFGWLSRPKPSAVVAVYQERIVILKASVEWPNGTLLEVIPKTSDQQHNMSKTCTQRRPVFGKEQGRIFATQLSDSSCNRPERRR